MYAGLRATGPGFQRNGYSRQRTPSSLTSIEISSRRVVITAKSP